MNVLTDWTLDPLPLALGVGAGALYLGGVRRLRARGRHWSSGRTTSFLAGIGLLLLATQSFVGRYDDALFSLHVVQHVLLGIAGPFFLALGAPVTLALQASRRGAQVNLLKMVNSRPARALTHPVVAFALFTATLFLLYFSPIYELSLRNGVVHGWVHVHFVVVGSLFFWVTIGLDPVARRVPFGARLLLVVLTVPFHAFLGLILISGPHPLAESYYASIARPVAVSPLADQHTGAGVMWVVGDLVGLTAGYVVAQQWWSHEERRAARLDRRLAGGVAPEPGP